MEVVPRTRELTPLRNGSPPDTPPFGRQWVEKAENLATAYLGGIPVGRS